VRCLPGERAPDAWQSTHWGRRLTSLDVGNRGSVSVIPDYGDCAGDSCRLNVRTELAVGATHIDEVPVSG
ncbi:MAG: hypothetical protein ACREYE_23855, partial [Gammaproteobacteria bacterium]